MNVLEAIAKRRSIRKFKSDRAVSRAELDVLLKAAMEAPSAVNNRSWCFITVTDRAVLQQIAQELAHTAMLKTAGAAIVVCADSRIPSGIAREYYLQDCAAASQNILLAALPLGLATTWCGIYPREERMDYLRGLLGIPQEVQPFSIIAVGAPAEQPAPRGGYDAERVHRERW